MSFLASEAAFDGFRLTRQHPRAVLAWAGVMLAANLASTVAVTLIAGPEWAAFEKAASERQPDMQALSALVGHIWPAAIVYLVIQLAATGVVHAAILRGLLDPARSPPLRLGRDEFRIVGLILGFIGVSFLATLVLGIVLGLFGAIGVGGAGLTSLAGMVVSVLLWVRLSLAGPMTIEEDRFRFWASWRATRGFGFKLLGAELLAAALAVAVFLLTHMLFLAIVGVIVLATGGNITDLPTMFSADIASPWSVFRPAPLIYLAFVSTLYGMVLAILLAPPVALYRVINGGERWEEGAGI
jgi:hypothetical protein